MSLYRRQSVLERLLYTVLRHTEVGGMTDSDNEWLKKVAVETERLVSPSVSVLYNSEEMKSSFSYYDTAHRLSLLYNIMLTYAQQRQQDNRRKRAHSQ